MSLPAPLPEVIVAGVCFVIFIFLLVKALCEASHEADERVELEAERLVVGEVRELEQLLSLPAREPGMRR